MKLRLVLMSDTHHHPLSKWVIPDGDVFIHSGDLMRGKKLKAITAFNSELQKLPHKHKLVVPGNHDWPFQRQREEAIAELTAATYLEDREIVIDGVKFYGSPWQPRFFNWAFNLDRGAPLKEKWDLIPEDTGVLITHGPPHGYGDRCDDGRVVGCEELRRALDRVRPLVHVYGHIHEGYGKRFLRHANGAETILVNASSCDSNYRPRQAPIIVDL